MPHLVSVDEARARVELPRPGPIAISACIGAWDDGARLLPIRHQAIGRTNRRGDALQWLLAEPAS